VNLEGNLHKVRIDKNGNEFDRMTALESEAHGEHGTHEGHTHD